MSQLNATQALQLGLHLEYLRGISSNAVHALNDLSGVPYLLENQPALRYAAPNVVAVLRSLAELLEAADLPKTREAAAEFVPMRDEVEAFLQENASPENVTLLDHFADRLAGIAEAVLKAVREELK